MSKLISQIMLAILLFPLAGIVYFVLFWVFINNYGWLSNSNGATFLGSGLFTWALIAVYWWGLWKSSVSWTASRIGWTLGCFALAAIAATIAGVLAGRIEVNIGFFVGSVTAPILWLIGTVFVWRETTAERAARHTSLTSPGASANIICPTCGYSMTGLKGTRCPECGSEFTLDQLLASQPGKAAQELEA